MSNLLPIHDCLKTAFENEKLLKQNSHLKHENECLLKELEKYEQYFNRNYHMIDVSVQTNIHTSYIQDQDSNTKLHEIHNSLLKRYEKEVNSNAVNKVTIDRLKAELLDYENKCKKLEKDKLGLLEKQTNFDYNVKNSLLSKIEHYKMKYKKCLNELRCFDEKFFDEIEDIKYFLQESLKLNEYYETVLHIKNGDGRKINEKFKKLKLFSKNDEDDLKMKVKFGGFSESISTIRTSGSSSYSSSTVCSDEDADC